jgi:hypothetical protein
MLNPVLTLILDSQADPLKIEKLARATFAYTLLTTPLINDASRFK